MRSTRPVCLILPILMLLVVGCSVRSSPSPLVTVKASVVSFLTYGPYFIAQEEGYFAEQGLKVEFVNFQRSSDAIPALAQGELDVLGGSINFGLLNAITRGAKIKIVADKGYSAVQGCAANAIVARKALVEGGLDSAAKLKGLHYSFNPASFNGYALDTALQRAGVDMAQVNAADVPDNIVLESFKTGAVDATVTSEPWITRLVQSGEGMVWYPLQDLLPNFQYGFVAFGPNLLEKTPDVGQRFMLAYLKGVQQFQAGKTERNLTILAKYTELDQETLKQACWPPFAATGQANVPSLMDFQTWALTRKYLDAIVPADKLWDGRFVEQAAKTLKLTK